MRNTDRLAIALLTLVATFSLAGFAGEPKPIRHDGHELKIDGKIETVEIERQIIVREKLPLAKSFPFTVSAESGGFGYVWDVPAGVQFKRAKHKIEISAAPIGTLTIGVEWTTAKIVNGDIEFEDHSGRITLVVGDVKPPDPLTLELRALYSADAGTDKAANVTKLAAVFAQAAQLARSDAVQTAMQLADAVRDVSKRLVPADALVSVRRRIGELITDALMDLDPEAPLDQKAREKAAALYGRIAGALEAIK